MELKASPPEEIVPPKINYLEKKVALVTILQTQSKKIVETYKENVAKINEFQAKQHELKSQLIDVNEILVAQIKEESNLPKQIEIIDNDKYAKNLTYLRNLLGFEITEFKMLDNKNVEMTLHFNEYCYLKFYIIDDTFDLQQIQPPHPRFMEIKEFLHQTQDVPGLLANVRNYFYLFSQTAHTNNQNKLY